MKAPEVVLSFDLLSSKGPVEYDSDDSQDDGDDANGLRVHFFIAHFLSSQGERGGVAGLHA
jgi:hypothetical protein